MRGLDGDERNAEHDQRDSDRLIVVKQLLKQIVPLEADDRRRNAGDNDLAPQTDNIAVDRDGRAAVTAVIALERPDLVPEQHDDRKDRAELNHDLEHFIECVRNVQLDKFVEQYHVARAADRQPFRDALHDTEQECLKPFHILYHYSSPSCAGRLEYRFPRSHVLFLL